MELFALDHHPGLPRAFPLTDAVDAMSGHVIARARLDGTYEIRSPLTGAGRIDTGTGPHAPQTPEAGIRVANPAGAIAYCGGL